MNQVRLYGLTAYGLPYMLPAMKKLTIQIDEGLLRQLKVVAAKKGVTVSEIVRDFVKWFVEKEA